MTINKLFNVLVLGGSMLVSTNGHASNDLTTDKIAFCTSTNECKEALSCTDQGDVIKKMVPKDGISCCWGTSCADLDALDSND